MVKFNVGESPRKRAANIEPYVKGAIIDLTYKKLGIESMARNGIYKYEGGVRIGQAEYVIKSNFVAFDYGIKPHNNDEIEEAIARSIEEVMNRLIWREITFTNNFQPCHVGDPLRDLLKN